MVQSEVSPIVSKPLGQIQADMFCPGCGYNLFSQAVLRDPHMGILVCRCPECGQYSPAGVSTDAANRWRHALGTWLLILRVLVLASLLITAVISMGALPYAFAEEMVWLWEYVGYQYQHMASWDNRIMEDRLIFAIGAIALGAGAGLVLVLGLYHWPRRFYRWALLLPALTLVVIGGIWHVDYSERPHQLFAPIAARSATIDQFVMADPQFRQLSLQRDVARASNHLQSSPMLAETQDLMEQRRQEIVAKVSAAEPLPSPAVHMAAMAGLITLGMSLGTFLGRPLTRGVLRMLLPARALQALGMLWFADGKTPPKPQ